MLTGHGTEASLFPPLWVRNRLAMSSSSHLWDDPNSRVLSTKHSSRHKGLSQGRMAAAQDVLSTQSPPHFCAEGWKLRQSLSLGHHHGLRSNGPGLPGTWSVFPTEQRLS